MRKNSSKTWLAVDVIIDPAGIEAVEHAFNILDALGTETDAWLPVKRDQVRVTGIFDATVDLAMVRKVINEALTLYKIDPDVVEKISFRVIEETDWLAEWKKHWKPTCVGRFIIAPPWEAVEQTDKIVIRIEPNMAFGTGTHETTQLCVQAIEQNYSEGQTFLDVGTGTGILAIAAAKMFDEQAQMFACDTDIDSVAIAKEIASLNGVGERIDFFHGPITNDTPVFDFVCANLTIDVIVPLMPLLLAKTSNTLVLSGILAEQKDIIQAELIRFQISNFKFQMKGEWMSVVIENT